MKFYNLASVLDGQTYLQSFDPAREKCREGMARFGLTDEEINTHLLLLGTTGGGKSRMLWQLLREHRRNDRGFGVIDSGDLIDDFLADCAHQIIHTGNTELLKKIHVVELSPFQLARYDPFRYFYPKHVHPELKDVVYHSWQHTKVQSVSEIYQWKQGQSTDFEGMPRLQRLFINVFTGISTLVRGKRLSIGDANILVDLGHPQHFDVYERLRSHLAREIVADFEILHGFKSVRDLRQETESFLNRIRSTHGPLLKEMLSGTGREPVIDLYQIIQRGDFLLVKVGKTPFASNDQNNALASMFIHDLIDTAVITSREFRRPFTLILEEAHKYVRPGIGDIARTARKYQLGLVLATTDLVSLKKGDLDLASELLSVINTVVTYRLTWPDDLKRMTEFMYAQNIDFSELVHEVERRAGPEWLQVDEWSENYGQQTGKAVTSGTTVTDGRTSQTASNRSTQKKLTTSYDTAWNISGRASATGQADSDGKANGTSHTNAVQNGATDTTSESFGVTINHKLVHIEKIVRELQKTGMLEKSVADQLAKLAQNISGHSRRRATARVREGKAVEIETLEVKDPFASPVAQAKAVEWIKRELYQIHDYYFTPTLDPRDEEERIRKFLEESTEASLHLNEQSQRRTHDSSHINSFD